VLMFVVPIALTYSGGLRAWWWILPVSTRRKLLRAWFRHRPSASAPRAVTGFLALNIVMVVTHVPVVFDYLLARSWAINVILDPAYVIAGLLFFRSLVPSSPRRVRSRMREQAAMVVGTMLIMFVSALSMSVFTKHAWFHVANYAHGFDFHFQQLGAGILWICGDFWAVPLLAVIVRRVIQRDGSLFSVLDARLPSGSAR